MCIVYEDVLKRLVEERYRLGLSQRQMGQSVRMNQSNYSKVELGLRRLSFHELKYLCESGVDIHYIYTGQKGTDVCDDFLSQCSYFELKGLLNIFYGFCLFRYREKSSDQWSEILEKLKYVPLLETDCGSNNIFFTIHHVMDTTQKKMSDSLGIDVKKLRDLENNRNLPDSELISRLYDIYHIPPSAILKDKKCIEKEIAALIALLDVQSMKTLVDAMKIMYNKK